MATWALAFPGSAETALSYLSIALSYSPSPSKALPAITCRADGSESDLSASSIASR